MTEFDMQADSEGDAAPACQLGAPVTVVPPAAFAEIAAIVQEYETAVRVEVQAIIHKHGKYGLN